MPTTAAHRNTSPAWEAMNGYRMYSPLAIPTPIRITLGPSSRRSGGGLRQLALLATVAA